MPRSGVSTTISDTVEAEYVQGVDVDTVLSAAQLNRDGTSRSGDMPKKMKTPVAGDKREGKGSAVQSPVSSPVLSTLPSAPIVSTSVSETLPQVAEKVEDQTRALTDRITALEEDLRKLRMTVDERDSTVHAELASLKKLIVTLSHSPDPPPSKKMWADQVQEEEDSITPELLGVELRGEDQTSTPQASEMPTGKPSSSSAPIASMIALLDMTAASATIADKKKALAPVPAGITKQVKVASKVASSSRYGGDVFDD